MRDLATLDIAPFLPPDVPPEVLTIIAGKPNGVILSVDEAALLPNSTT